MKTGDVVMSVSGHDKGRLYVVIKTGDFPLLCDGKRKLLQNPKKKNSRHLKETGERVDLSSYNPLYDAHIRKALKSVAKCVSKDICL
ncbi:MAG: hypothetical protein IKB12_06755 [Clostridia bacterium]|nr:hypothetical protein [Clostridia bacterium]